MVEYVEAKIVEAKPAYAYFTHPVFGRVEMELIPLQAIAATFRSLGLSKRGWPPTHL